MFYRTESISCLYFILLSVLIIYDVTLTAVIMSELHHFNSWINSVICLMKVYVKSSFYPFMCVSIILYFINLF